MLEITEHKKDGHLDYICVSNSRSYTVAIIDWDEAAKKFRIKFFYYKFTMEELAQILEAYENALKNNNQELTPIT